MYDRLLRLLLWRFPGLCENACMHHSILVSNVLQIFSNKTRPVSASIKTADWAYSSSGFSSASTIISCSKVNSSKNSLYVINCNLSLSVSANGSIATLVRIFFSSCLISFIKCNFIKVILSFDKFFVLFENSCKDVKY